MLGVELGLLARLTGSRPIIAIGRDLVDSEAASPRRESIAPARRLATVVALPFTERRQERLRHHALGLGGLSATGACSAGVPSVRCRGSRTN